MSFFPQTLIVALCASLFVAIVINPVVSARFQTAKRLEGVSGDRGLVKRVYAVLLRQALNHRLTVVLMGILVFIASLTLFAVFGKGTEFFPQVEPRRAYIYIKTPEGTNLDASDTIVAQSERIAADYRTSSTLSPMWDLWRRPFFTRRYRDSHQQVALDFVTFMTAPSLFRGCERNPSEVQGASKARRCR